MSKSLLTPEEKKARKRAGNKKWRDNNSEYHAARKQEWGKKNRARINAGRRAKYARDLEYRARLNARNRAQYQADKQKPGFRKKESERYATLYNSTPDFRIRKSLSVRIHASLVGKTKSAKTLELLGCTIEFLWAHLEKQFVPGMTRENYGPVWHVDHILPCAEFHLQHSEEQEICFHWTNLQPLFAADNLSKGDRII